jgi:hypothetical protein
MVTKLVLGAIYTGVPGAYSLVDASGMGRLSPTALGVVALLGEAEGGGAAAQIVSCTSPQAVLDTFRSGPLREMGLIAFDPSNDAVVGGALKVLAVKVNPATRAQAMLTNVDGNALLVQSKDYGQFANQIHLAKDLTGALPTGTAELAVYFESDSELYDEIGGDPWLSLAYSTGGGLGYDVAGLRVGVDALLNPDKVYVEAAKTAMADAPTGVTFTAGDAAVVACNAANNGHTITIYGIDSDGEPTYEAGLIAAAAYTTAKKWQRVTAAKLSAAASTGDLTVADAHGNTCLTLHFGASTSDWDAGLYSETRHVPNLGNLPVANRPVYLVASGATTDPVVLRGRDASGNVQTEVITLAGAVAVSGFKSWSKIEQIEVGGVDPLRTVTLGPTTNRVVAVDARMTASNANAVSKALFGTYTAAFVSGNRARVVSGSAADVSLAVAVHGLDVAGSYQTETITTDAALGTTAVFGTKTWSKVFSATILTYAVGIITISDEAPTTAQSIPVGKLTSGLLAGPTEGYYALDMPVDNTTVSVAADAGTTRQVMLVGLDLAGAVQREVLTLAGAAVVATTGTWTRITGIYTGDLEAARHVHVTAAYPISGGISTMQQVADCFTAASGFTGTVLTGAPTTDLISDLDNPTVASYGSAQPLSVLGVTVNLYAKLEELIRAVNAASQYITVSRPDGATGLPADTVADVYLAGGGEGVSAYAHWLAAIAAIRLSGEPGTIVPLTSNAAVHAAIKAQTRARAQTLRTECDAKVGLPSGTTKANLKLLIQALNDRNVQVCAQDVQRYDSNGVLTTFEPYAQAVIAAGMQAGGAVGTPLTRKLLNVVDVVEGTGCDWNPTDDREELLDAGLCFAEEVPGVGFRWVRGITSYLQGTNLAYIEASCNQAVNVFIRNLRSWLDTMIGSLNFAGTLTATHSLLVQGLEYAVNQRWILEWRNISMVLTGDEIRVSFEVAPGGVPLNFIPINAHLYQYEAAA